MTNTSPPPLIPHFAADTTVKIIGLGGIGSIVSEYAALWLCAQAIAHEDVSFRLVLIDGDAFEPWYPSSICRMPSESRNLLTSA